ncbi:MAG: HD domain-containing protein [Nitrospirae bacterium]|nr:HD domain-containing protein [Nitrospirota bacterium]
MRNKLAIGVTFFGWVILAAFVLADYHACGSLLFSHFLSFRPIDIIFHIIALATPIGSTITGYLINERGKLLEKAQTSEKNLHSVLREWRATIDSMPYGIMLVDSKFNIIRANRYIAELSGMPLKELRFKKCYEAVHGKEGRIDRCPLLHSFRTGIPEMYEFYDTGKDKHFLANVSPIFDEGGSVTAYSHSLIDISDIKKKEKKLTDSKDAFLNILRDINASHKDLKAMYHDLIIAFSIAIDAKSPWTKGHSERVTHYAVLTAREMRMKSQDIDALMTAGLLHDIGKIGTYDVILEKPTKLNDEEFSLIKNHPVKGEEILRPIKEFKGVLPIVKSHHEKFDGTGYPCGLKGGDIPLSARILCVADSFDSMTSDRPYRPAPGREHAISELKRCSGTQFDPKVVEAFLKVLEKEAEAATAFSSQVV